jgi:hypothetical protein
MRGSEFESPPPAPERGLGGLNWLLVMVLGLEPGGIFLAAHWKPTNNPVGYYLGLVRLGGPARVLVVGIENSLSMRNDLDLRRFDLVFVGQREPWG